MSATPTTTQSNRLPRGQTIAFSAACGFDYLATGVTIGILWMPFFNIGLGYSAAALGLLLMASKIWDAVLDPLMGHLSDNTRSRWGRRRPYMLVGATLTALMLPLLWRPLDGVFPEPIVAWVGDFLRDTLSVEVEQSHVGPLLYLTLLSMIFYAVFTVWAMPYYGMQLELTPDYDERTRIAAWMSFFGKLYTLAAAGIMPFATSAWFQNADGRPDLVAGIRFSIWFLAGSVMILGILPAAFVRERFTPAELNRQPTEPFWPNFVACLRCTPMWSLVSVSFLVVLGNASVGVIGSYLNIYLVNLGDLNKAANLTFWITAVPIVTSLLSIPFWTWMSKRYDKPAMLALVIGLGTVGHLLNYFCMRADMPYLQLVPAFFNAAIMSAIWMFVPSMKGDVADYDELHTHRRREGALNAFFSWFFKLALAAAAGVGGYALQLTGFDPSLPLQSEAVLSRMMAVYLSLPAIIWTVAIVVVLRYPLNRTRMHEISRKLTDRAARLGTPN